MSTRAKENVGGAFGLFCLRGGIQRNGASGVDVRERRDRWQGDSGRASSGARAREGGAEVVDRLNGAAGKRVDESRLASLMEVSAKL